jgi:hypothetical protein
VSTVAPDSMTLRGYKKREIKIAEVRRTGICRVPNRISFLITNTDKALCCGTIAKPGSERPLSHRYKLSICYWRSYRDRVLASTGRDPLRCRRCGGEMMLWQVWHPRYRVVYDELQAIKRGRYGPCRGSPPPAKRSTGGLEASSLLDHRPRPAVSFSWGLQSTGASRWPAVFCLISRCTSCCGWHALCAWCECS